MTLPSITTTPRRQDLDWLLEDFIQRVPGVREAVLGSRDGVKLSFAGLGDDDADQLAAVMASLYALGRGEVTVPGHDVRQIVIETDEGFTYVMSSGGQMPADAGAAVVSSVVGVRTSTDADPGVVGHEMVRLITGVAEHLLIPTRSPGQ
ncbi:roadblock/LC7 domain-containing protein [Streptomyces cyaneofuscatus]|uniref:roadblock/LC7 domain-containing protein n=1 Tax=Streptomyces cyaneofuscatus TaxID=66883 RepID=UPI003CF91CCD